MAFSRRRRTRRRRSRKQRGGCACNASKVGGGKAKMGAKSNPFSSKRRAMKSRRKGKVYFRKKGRKYSMKK
jgi:hypothetical protein